MGVPSSTCSPALTRISVSSASETATETRGMRMTKSATGARRVKRPHRRLDDPGSRRVELCLQRRGGGSRHESGTHPFDRRRELAETLGLKSGDDFRTGTGELDRVVHDHRPPGTTYRFDDGLDVQRDERAKIDDLGIDALVLQETRGRQRLEHAASVADEGDVGAGPLDIGLTERNGEAGIGWHHALLTLQANGLDE